MKRFFRRRKKEEVSFDEILLDASNLPSFNKARLEGRIELPLRSWNILSVGIIFCIIVTLFLYRLIALQVVDGEHYAMVSTENKISETIMIAERGPVYDRRHELIAWNEVGNDDLHDFPMRAYTDRLGVGQLVGYVSYPQKDRAGFYYDTEYRGRSGIEETFNEALQGTNGKQLVEMNALGEVISGSVIDTAKAGAELELAVDTELSEQLYQVLASSSLELGFRSGAGALMDVTNGEIIALTSFPSYDPELLSDGEDGDAIAALGQDTRYPFLNKVIGGVYTPGSIVKPFVAYAALAEGIISPERQIASYGSITIPNPYNPDQPSVFNDWRSHGIMTMRDAIAYSSNVYFYTIGGGFEDQRGLGITKMRKYFDVFGIGEKTGIDLLGEVEGTVPSPEWKLEVFDDEWRLGDTYFTAIGQYGFLTTPLSMLRAYAALANGGTLLSPTVLKGGEAERIDLGLDPDYLRVVQEGMRRTVIQAGGTARALERSDVEIAAKSGTAELDGRNEFVNSWIAGYFPYDKPKYAFILLLEHGPYTNTLGAGRVMSWVFNWMAEHRPEYLHGEAEADVDD